MAATNQQQQQPEEGIFGAENLTSAFLEPITSEAEIDYNLVYALFTFVASMEGQISVLKGEPLELLDDSNSYWWAVKCLSTGEIGYIPAENIETPYEKLARFNRQRNVDFASVKSRDLIDIRSKIKKKLNGGGGGGGKIVFAEYHTEIYTDGESELGSQGQQGGGGQYDEEGEENGSEGGERQLTSSMSSGGVAQKEKKAGFLDRFFKPKQPEQQTQNTSSANNTSGGRNGGGARKMSQPIRRHSVEDKEGQVTRDLDKAPINVLRVFTGNVTFNTTFKSVSFERGTLISDLLINTLKKFRVNNVDPSKFYLTVLPLQSHPDVEAIGERKLLPNENINTVLDSYGVMSFISESLNREKDGRKNSLSRVNQADGTIKITIYQFTDRDLNKTIPVRVCIDEEELVGGSGGGSRWEEINVNWETTTKILMDLSKRIFGVEGTFRVYNMATGQFVEENVPIMPLAEAIASSGKNQQLSLKLQPNLDRMGNRLQEDGGSGSRPSRLDPGRPQQQQQPTNSSSSSKPPIRKGTKFEKPSTIDPSGGNSKQSRQEQEKSISKYQQEDQEEEVEEEEGPQGPDFDSMLANLDKSITQHTKLRETQPTPPLIPLGQVLGDLERDLENLISLSLEKTAKNRKSSRLSMLYNANRRSLDGDIDTEKLFLSFKDTGSDLTRLQLNLDGMLSHLLQRNGIIGQTI